MAAAFLRDLAKDAAADGQIVYAITTDNNTGNIPGLKAWRLKGNGHSREDRLTITKAVEETHPDIIHIHSMWGIAAREVYRQAKGRRIPFVVSTHKELMEWNISYRRLTRKLPAQILYQRAMLRDAAALHLVSEQERQRIKDNPSLTGYDNAQDAEAKCCVIPRDRAGQRQASQLMRRFYRKVADSNPFMLMTAAERRQKICSSPTEWLSPLPRTAERFSYQKKQQTDVSPISPKRDGGGCSCMPTVRECCSPWQGQWRSCSRNAK